jgi:hypothetical protein
MSGNLFRDDAADGPENRSLLQAEVSTFSSLRLATLTARAARRRKRRNKSGLFKEREQAEADLVHNRRIPLRSGARARARAAHACVQRPRFCPRPISFASAERALA